MAEAVTRLPDDADAGDPSTGEQKTRLARRVGPLLLLFHHRRHPRRRDLCPRRRGRGGDGRRDLDRLHGGVDPRAADRLRLRRARLEVPPPAGAALYVNRAFRQPFLTFMIAFAVMASGITSASTLARAFGSDAQPSSSTSRSSRSRSSS